MLYKHAIIPIFAFVTFSILIMFQIDMDASTTDFKVDGVINTSCAQNLDDSDWASCKETLEQDAIEVSYVIPAILQIILLKALLICVKKRIL